MYRLIVILLLLCVTWVGKAQEFQYSYVDSLTYVQFLTGKYPELEKTGKRAIERNIDFYYLRMRLGIAQYEQHHFEKALLHFEKASEMNPADTSLQEYLYYARLFSGRVQEARLMAESFSPALKKKIHFRDRGLETLSLETGNSITRNISNHENPQTNPDLTEQGLYTYHGNIFYGKIFMQHVADKRVVIQNALAVYRTSSLALSKDPNLVLSDPYHSTHFQYNFSMNIQLNRGWNLSGGLGYYHFQYTTVLHGFDKQQRHPFLYNEYFGGNYFSGSLTLGKRFRYFGPYLSAAYTNMAGTDHYQAEAGFTLYPLGNLNFYLVSQGTYLPVQNHQPYVFTQKIGFTMGSHLSCEGLFLYGNLDNYLASNGFIAYNSFDPLLLTGGIDFKIRIKKTQFIPSYRYQLKQGSLDLPSGTSKIFNYTNHFLILTVLWNF